MTHTNTFPDVKGLLIRLGYPEARTQDILEELNNLFKEIDFDKIKQASDSALEEKDKTRLISLLNDLMILLEKRGYYRPDFPRYLLVLLVNGLNRRGENIFSILEKARIPEKEKRKEIEFLVSCAAITQLGYILLSCLVPEVKAATAGPHVFTIIECFPPNPIFVDFSLDSIREINVQQAYYQEENYYYLKNIAIFDKETSELVAKYYSFFHVVHGSGLSHNIHNNLGIAYDEVGRYEEAIEEFQEALRLDSGYIEVHNNLAVTYDKMGRYEEAIMELQEALRINPDYMEAHTNLGNIYVKLGRYDQAIAELKEAIKLNPSYAPAHNNLGNIYAEQKRNQEAIEEFQEALRLNPSYALVHNNLGNIYAEMGKLEDAVREFQEALSLDPEFPEAHHGLGLLYYSMGKFDRAVHAWIRAVYLNPEFLESVPEKLRLKVGQGISRLKS
jgi:tetratricopeptide (TPR) repeat protein